MIHLLQLTSLPQLPRVPEDWVSMTLLLLQLTWTPICQHSSSRLPSMILVFSGRFGDSNLFVKEVVSSLNQSPRQLRLQLQLTWPASISEDQPRQRLQSQTQTRFPLHRPPLLLCKPVPVVDSIYSMTHQRKLSQFSNNNHRPSSNRSQLKNQ